MAESSERSAVAQSVSEAASAVTLRKAALADVGALHAIINHYAAEQLMLPKTHLQLYESLRDYTVAVEGSDPSAVLGCGALAVRPGITQKGVGTTIVEELIDEGRSLGLARLFVFTYVARFFGRFGFVQVEHRSLPLKVYNECFHCPKFNTCDEIAMVLDL